jgi:hypothetical protein
MTGFREKYINPFTDYGFKRLFGEEPNKDLLLDFLNELLKEEQGEIIELTYLKNENLSTTELNRKAIFDLYCTNERGEKFIVELQKPSKNFSRTGQSIIRLSQSGSKLSLAVSGVLSLKRFIQLQYSTLFLMKTNINQKNCVMM